MGKPKLSSGDRHAAWEDRETRQQFASMRVREYQRAHQQFGLPFSFADLLSVFLTAGIQYDNGLRLRDFESAA